MQYDFIGLEEAGITGTINSILTIKGQVKKDNYSLKILFDNKKEEYENLYKEEQQRFYIKKKIPKETKNIEAIVIVNNKKYPIFSVKTSMQKRLIKGVIRNIKTPGRVVKHFLNVSYRELGYLWKQHHFLVPPILIPRYLHDFKSRLYQEKMFYNPLVPTEYRTWIKRKEKDIKTKTLGFNPLITMILPVYNEDGKNLRECLDSVLNQSYINWELCIIDNCSKKKETISILKEYAKKDKRIIVKFKRIHGNKSKACNDGIKMSKGTFIALLDSDAILNKNALYCMANELNKNKKLDLIYSDEDKLDLEGKRCSPHFKPNYSPDTLLSLNYISHFTIIRKKLVESVGGFEEGLDGAHDYDLYLKITEKTNKISHISRILYHSRTHQTQINNIKKGKKVLENALKRRNINGEVTIDDKSNYYRIKYILEKEPLVSIIIPIRDYAEMTKKCLDSIYKKTKYKNYEIIIANNDSKEKETFDLFKEMKKKHKNFRVVDVNIEFNYSKINNIAVKEAKGEIIVLLNNDTEIISPDWLSDMASYASQDHIGIVGAKLLYPDETVQHAGVILGLGGVASHAYIGASREDTGLFGRLRVPYNYSANTAACLAVKKSLYNKVGGLEEDLKIAYNDIDLNIKVSEEGYYNIFLPQVEITHYESKSRGLELTYKKYKRFLKEVKYMNKKWKEKVKTDYYYNENFSKRGWFMLPRKK